jgi:hydroxyacylglutathione hydrolase
MPHYEIEHILVGDNYTYFVIRGSEAVIVDPSESDAVLGFIESHSLRCTGILNTHNHFDHTDGNNDLKKATGCLVVGPHPDIPAVDIIAEEGIELDRYMPGLEVLSVPGHATTSVAYYVPSAGIVFTGDTLFAGGCGRLMGCSARTMYDSLMRLASLPLETLVYCGHEYTLENLRFAALAEPDNAAVWNRLREVKLLYKEGKTTMPSTIGLERETNPFLRADSIGIRKSLNMNEKSPVEVFTELRKRKDVF